MLGLLQNVVGDTAMSTDDWTSLQVITAVENRFYRIMSGAGKP
jgi:hypothetical protein